MISPGTGPLPRSTPAAQGVAAGAVLDFLDAVDSAGLELHSLMLLRHGHVVAEGWWAPYARQIPHLLYSLSKSFTSIAAGLAIAEGRFGLDDRLLDHLGSYAPADAPSRTAEITVRHALTMSTGHHDDPVYDVIDSALERADPEWLRAFFAMPPESPPGTVFAYNQLATYAVARIVEQTCGQRMVDYLTPRLFGPLGIDEQCWLTQGGHDCGFSGLHLTTESVAKFGQLCLDRGRWGDRWPVPSDWLRQATIVQMANDAVHRAPTAEPPNPDWRTGYGFQFWIGRHGYRGDGAYGQFCLVWPDHDAVVVTTAATSELQTLLDCAYDHLGRAVSEPPGTGTAGAPSGGAGAEVALRRRLAAAAIAPPVDHGAPTSLLATGIVGFDRTGGDGAPGVSGVGLAAAEGGWELELTMAGGKHRIAVGRGSWVEASWPADPVVPLQTAGGWDPAGVFVARLILIRTPHSVWVRLNPANRSCTLEWALPSLHGPDPARLAV